MYGQSDFKTTSKSMIILLFSSLFPERLICWKETRFSLWLHHAKKLGRQFLNSMRRGTLNGRWNGPQNNTVTFFVVRILPWQPSDVALVCASSWQHGRKYHVLNHPKTPNHGCRQGFSVPKQTETFDAKILYARVLQSNIESLKKKWVERKHSTFPARSSTPFCFMISWYFDSISALQKGKVKSS